MTTRVNKTALIFMAHPDDAEFHCGGTLALLAELGWRVHIVSATAGQCGTMKHSREEIAAIRKKEAAAAAALIGAEFHCLDEPDGMLMYDRPTLQATLDLFRRICPAVVITHHPFDYHPDHEAASRLARTASFLYPAPNCSTQPLEGEATVPFLYYADANEGVDFLGRAVTPTTYVDITSKMAMKKQMLLCHESQVAWVEEHHALASFTQAVEDHAATRGQEIGSGQAEAFVQHRGHGYPREDLFAAILATPLEPVRN